MVGSAAHAMVMRSNFGIKSFYPKIRGHVLTPKFGSREGGHKVGDLSKESRNIQQDRLTKLASTE